MIVSVFIAKQEKEVYFLSPVSLMYKAEYFYLSYLLLRCTGIEKLKLINKPQRLKNGCIKVSNIFRISKKRTFGSQKMNLKK